MNIWAGGPDVISTKSFFVALLALTLTGMAQVHAQGPDTAPTISLVFENDFFASDDFNYTNGSKLTYLSGVHEPEGISAFLAERLFDDYYPSNAYAWHGFGLGQSLYTPEDTLATAPLPDEHPYGAYLYGEYTSIVARRNQMTQFTAQIGIVGPSAQGETTQNLVHTIVGGEEAEGWDNQIGDELAIGLTLDRRRRIGMAFGQSDYSIDFIPGWGATVGNLRTDVHAGFTLRLGENLAYDYGPPRVLPGLRGTNYFSRKQGFSWHIFGGVEGRAVAYDIFVDGRLFADDIVTADRNPLVGDAQGGLVLQYGPVQVSYIHVFRSASFDKSQGSDEFGALSFALKMAEF